MHTPGLESQHIDSRCTLLGSERGRETTTDITADACVSCRCEQVALCILTLLFAFSHFPHALRSLSECFSKRSGSCQHSPQPPLRIPTSWGFTERISLMRAICLAVSPCTAAVCCCFVWPGRTTTGLHGLSRASITQCLQRIPMRALHPDVSHAREKNRQT